MFEKLRPLGDRVLVKRLESEERTASGIIIPDNAKEKAQTGKVVAVGTGRFDATGKKIAMDVKQGDTIFFGKYAGTEADKEHLIISQDEILGIIEQ